MSIDRDDYLDEVLIGGRELANIVVVDDGRARPAHFDGPATVPRRSLRRRVRLAVAEALEDQG